MSITATIIFTVFFLLLLTLNYFLFLLSAQQPTGNHSNNRKKLVDYKHIVQNVEYKHPKIDESEIPPLC